MAADRTQNLEQSKWMYAFKRESSDFEEWINEQLQLAASEEYGQDYEHLQVCDLFVFNVLDRLMPQVINYFKIFHISIKLKI